CRKGCGTAEDHISGRVRLGGVARNGRAIAPSRARRLGRLWGKRCAAPPNRGFHREPESLSRSRLDQVLVDRQLVASREKAQAVILAGQVIVNGQKATKAGQLVDAETRIELLQPPRYVSRG